jgi:hypothetical protein
MMTIKIDYRPLHPDVLPYKRSHYYDNVAHFLMHFHEIVYPNKCSPVFILHPIHKEDCNKEYATILITRSYNEMYHYLKGTYVLKNTKCLKVIEVATYTEAADSIKSKTAQSSKA